MARDGAVGQGVLMRGVLKVRWITVVAIVLGAMAVTALARAQTAPESTPAINGGTAADPAGPSGGRASGVDRAISQVSRSGC